MLKYDKEKLELLIPEKAKSECYKAFYKENLDKDIPILKPIDEIEDDIEIYIETKLESIKARI